jgi:hypothetical protein
VRASNYSLTSGYYFDRFGLKAAARWEGEKKRREASVSVCVCVWELDRKKEKNGRAPCGSLFWNFFPVLCVSPYFFSFCPPPPSSRRRGRRCYLLVCYSLVALARLRFQQRRRFKRFWQFDLTG